VRGGSTNRRDRVAVLVFERHGVVQLRKQSCLPPLMSEEKEGKERREWGASVRRAQSPEVC
jgi:hypothetical protein